MTTYNGSSKERAIKVNAADETSGVDAEYDYLDKLLGDWKLVEQSVIVEEKIYDVLVIETKNKLHTFWFDITSFYGR
jgi:hypothetical protein